MTEPIADVPADVASDVSNGCFGSILIFLTVILSTSFGLYLTSKLL
jgi:hypothetical protein